MLPTTTISGPEPGVLMPRRPRDRGVSLAANRFQDEGLGRHRIDGVPVVHVGAAGVVIGAGLPPGDRGPGRRSTTVIPLVNVPSSSTSTRRSS